ncbi:MAG: DUF4954 family protein [Planctomycetaceae bacterium]|nr:MAG: DUF4954 family protein [Planctomycetaceae bacterium]
MLNNLVFPAHEQHHNNSFLVAALMMGQSNIAAGATIGSNHNSRANDGEIVAGRGFWPGLCTTLKHSSRFASFVLLAKGDYPYELQIPLPFSLVRDDVAHHRLVVTPAYWWVGNLYALARNEWKYQARDTRKVKTQRIEFATFAPDSVEEILKAITLLERWTGKAAYLRQGQDPKQASDEDLIQVGQRLVNGPESEMADLEIFGEGMERSQRKTVLNKVWRGYRAYREMAFYYAAKQIVDYLRTHSDMSVDDLSHRLGGQRQQDWVNLGGQLVPAEDVDTLRDDIRTGQLDTWSEIHDRYEQLWDAYPLAKQRHAYSTLLLLLQTDHLTPSLWSDALRKLIQIQEHICDQVYQTRKKDFDNSFRQMTFRNVAEMAAVLGDVDQDPFVKRVAEQTQELRQFIQDRWQRTFRPDPCIQREGLAH